MVVEEEEEEGRCALKAGGRLSGKIHLGENKPLRERRRAASVFFRERERERAWRPRFVGKCPRHTRGCVWRSTVSLRNRSATDCQLVFQVLPGP